MTVREIVQEYLKTNGYDGLYSCDGECGCKADDLAPCGEVGGDCEPGYAVPCPGPDACHNGGCDWHIRGTSEPIPIQYRTRIATKR